MNLDRRVFPQMWRNSSANAGRAKSPASFSSEASTRTYKERVATNRWSFCRFQKPRAKHFSSSPIVSFPRSRTFAAQLAKSADWPARISRRKVCKASSSSIWGHRANPGCGLTTHTHLPLIGQVIKRWRERTSIFPDRRRRKPSAARVFAPVARVGEERKRAGSSPTKRQNARTCEAWGLVAPNSD